MADVRALLKAKRQEARINHPYAAYGANGALRCTACGVAVKVASAWEGHLASKSHRVAVAKLKAKEEEDEEESARPALSKRKAEEQDGDDDDDDDDDDDRQMQVEVEGGTEVEVPPRKGKRQHAEEREVDGQAQASSRSFPADFFSDPSRAAPPRDDEGEDDAMMDQDQDRDREKRPTKTTAAPRSQFDMEWDAFERDMQSLSRPVGAAPTDSGGGGAGGAGAGGAEATGDDDPQVAYARATIAAEPELVPSLVGLPQGPASGDDAGAGAGMQGADEEGKRKAVAMSEEEERKRKEVDERELIMDRLVDEERAQEDAYTRVALLRNKVQMLKQKRQLAKEKVIKADTQT